MPDEIATPPPVATVESVKASPDAFSNLNLEGDVRQILEEVEQEEQQQAKPEGKGNESSEAGNKDGEETPTETVDPESVDKVFIKGKDGEQLEAPIVDVVKDALGEETLSLNAEGKAVFEIKADGQLYEGDLSQVKKWASHGIKANRTIQQANESIAQAEAAIADTQRLVQTTAETLANQKVEQLIDLLSRGIDPSTNQPYVDDNMRQGAENMAGKLSQNQIAQRLKQLEDGLKQRSEQENQGLRSQREAQLTSNAKAKMETVFNPFTQYFTTDGKLNEGLMTRFKENVLTKVQFEEIPKYRKEIGTAPDISPDWVAETTKRVAKEIFKDYQGVLKPQPKIVPSSQKPLRVAAKSNLKPQPVERKKSLDWDAEREEIERELGLRK